MFRKGKYRNTEFFVVYTIRKMELFICRPTDYSSPPPSKPPSSKPPSNPPASKPAKLSMDALPSAESIKTLSLIQMNIPATVAQKPEI